MKKVLITSRSFGRISDQPMSILKNAGFEVVRMDQGFDQEVFNASIVDYDALIIGAHPFPPEVMEKCSKLKIICKHGVGLDNIPLEKAKELGIAVSNTPGTNSNAVADLAFGIMLSLARRIGEANALVLDHQWKTVIGVDVYAKTLGLIGFGAIAKNVARRAAGFSMKVLVYDPFVKEIPDEFRSYVELCSFDQVIENSDFVSIHVPLTDETRGLFSLTEMKRMKKTSFLINTSRGGIVDEKDLYEAVSTGIIAGAGTDVPVKEPMEDDNPLRILPNMVITPHIGMYSKEAVEAISLICANNAVAACEGKEIVHRVV